MQRAMAVARRGLAGWLVVAATVWAQPAVGSDVRFLGSVGYSHLVNIVLLHSDQIKNFSTTTSGALRMELWATPSPFSGSFAGGVQLASYGVAPLAAGAAVTNVSSGTLPWTEPPTAWWYVTLVLTEQSGGSYVPRSWLGFPDKILGNGGGGTPADTTSPSVSMASPTGGNVSATVTLSANASDNVGVARVDFYVNGALLGSDSTAPYQYSWNTTALANGNATLRAVAFDAAGNSAQSANVAVTIANVVIPPPDTTPPSVGITSPTGGNVAGTVTVAANASDNVGVTRVDFYVNGALAGSDGGAPYQYSWNTAALTNGNATLRAVAFDAAGNSGQSANVTVTIANVVIPPPDTTPPTVGIASPTGGNVAGIATIAANASDNVGVARVDFYVNGALVSSDPSAPYQAAWNTAALANGAAMLRAVAIDAAGNSGQSATVTVTIANVVATPPDVAAPVVTLLTPTGGTVSGKINVTASATDNVGVARLDLLANGAVVATTTRAPWKFTWNSRSVSDGVVQLQLAAQDAAGNRATSTTVTVVVANAGGKPRRAAIEYYHAKFDHYFITAMPEEIIALDSGRFSGWTRTGSAIDVYDAGTTDGSPVCRFYIPPQRGDSHFYSASSVECEGVAKRYPDFAYESTEVFRIDTPDADTGHCPPETVPVYRVWNNRFDSNHRYTTDRTLRDQMVQKGYIAEGFGPDSVMMCTSP